MYDNQFSFVNDSMTTYKINKIIKKSVGMRVCQESCDDRQFDGPFLTLGVRSFALSVS